MEAKSQKPGDKLFKKISRKVGQTLRDHELIGENDRVLLALSGGKDSMILLESLVERKKAIPFHFDLFIAHIVPENIDYGENATRLRDFCRTLGLELIVRKTRFELIDEKKSICFVCSWHRRKALFDLTRELNCNKLAFGHHRDDALQTFFINLIYHGSISSMPYKLSMFDGRIDLIRPMLDLWEKDLLQLARLRNYNHEEKKCPHQETSKRAFTEELLSLIETTHPNARVNMFHALGNIYPEYLPAVKKKLKT